jgi:hypothetical protein
VDGAEQVHLLLCCCRFELMPALHRLAPAPKLQRDTISRSEAPFKIASTDAEHMAVLP